MSKSFQKNIICYKLEQKLDMSYYITYFIYLFFYIYLDSHIYLPLFHKYMLTNTQGSIMSLRLYMTHL